MLKFVAVAIAAGLLAIAPDLTTTAQATEAQSNIKLAQAGVTVRVGEPGYRHRSRHHRHWRDARACTTKVIYRNGSKTVVKRCR
jgi:hypothetical protein